MDTIPLDIPKLCTRLCLRTISDWRNLAWNRRYICMYKSRNYWHNFQSSHRIREIQSHTRFHLYYTTLGSHKIFFRLFEILQIFEFRKTVWPLKLNANPARTTKALATFDQFHASLAYFAGSMFTFVVFFVLLIVGYDWPIFIGVKVWKWSLKLKYPNWRRQSVISSVQFLPSQSE